MKRVVVVLPFTPVTATMGMRPFSPAGKSVSTIASPTGREMPTDGPVHPQPGGGVHFHDHAALLFQRPLMSCATTSMPAMSRPTILAASTAAGGHGGVDPLGHVDRRAAGAQIGVAADQDDGAGGGIEAPPCSP
jgi:hypothetical protein